VPFAVNVAATGVSEPVRPFMGLVEQLGRFFGSLHDRVPDSIEVEVQGALAAERTDILTLCALKGLFATSTADPVSYVNVPQMAERRGLKVRETSTSGSSEYVNLITLRSGSHSVAGTLTGSHDEPRVVMVDDHAVEVTPSPHMLVIRNDDRPGMIGVVGTALGEAGISIHSMALEPTSQGNTALMVLSVDSVVADAVVSRLAQSSGILGVDRINI
jgi:D-3-phosphoglycerate dehydrogenase / 2-oxoglutarate reductase